MEEELFPKENNEAKDVVVNSENTEEKKESAKTVKPKFFLDPKEKIECIVNGFYNKETGILEFAVPGEIKEESERFCVVKHVFYFSRIPYNRLNNYRSQSMIYNQSDRSHSVNTLKLREFFWIFHLEDWNFEDENGNKVDVKKDQNEALSDDTMDLLYSIPASILDTAIALYERRINIA